MLNQPMMEKLVAMRLQGMVEGLNLGDHFKSGQRLSVQNRPRRVPRNVDVLSRHPLFRQG